MPATTQDGPNRTARILAQSMDSDELRRWCAENGIERSRGDTKMETARKAVDQKPKVVMERLF